MTRAVLFDLDGTLADTADDLAAALNRLLQEQQRPEKPAAVLRREASRGARAMVRAGFGNSTGDDEFEQKFQSLRHSFSLGWNMCSNFNIWHDQTILNLLYLKA